jgi:hypothetical protein
MAGKGSWVETGTRNVIKMQEEMRTGMKIKGKDRT